MARANCHLRYADAQPAASLLWRTEFQAFSCGAIHTRSR
jgi:hypothetical protein